MAKQTNTNNQFQKSLVNLFLNLTIFVLGVLIIYMTYSLFIKINKTDKPVVDGVTKEKPAEIIQAEVLNGCGVSGLADRITDYLRDRNVDVVNSGNYFTFDVKETLVIDRIGNKANAEAVAKMLGVNKKNILQHLNEEYFLDVSVIIGNDYYKLKPFN